MPSLDDVYDQLKQMNTNLQKLDLDLQTNLQKLDGDIQTIATELTYTNQALYNISQQDSTIICILEHISDNSCKLLNEAHNQTGLQTSIKESISTLVSIFKYVHPDASLEHERNKELQKKILECCPPTEPEPTCVYEPCQAPQPLGSPPENQPPIA